MKVNPWIECACGKVHNRSVVGFTFRCACGTLIGGTEKPDPEPLETMPSWAQEIVYITACGLVEDEKATWEWYRGRDNYVLIKAHGFTYIVSHTGIR